MHRRLAAAATLCATLLLAACTQHAPQPPPPPASGPKMPSDAPSSAAPSPSASPTADPDAADKAAVEKAYRTQFAEFNRLEMAGGAPKLTRALLDTTSGVYRRLLLSSLRSDSRDHIHQVNSGKLVSVVVGPGNHSRRKLTACEDYSHSSWVRKDGSKVKVDQPILYVQHSTAKRGSDGKWRIDYTSTATVKKLTTAACHGTA